MKTLDQLTEKLNISTDRRQVKELVFDSRKICEGCLYIAIKGAKFDGHSAIAQAAEKKAAAVLAQYADDEQKKACEEAGIRSISYELPGDTREEDLIELIEKLNEDEKVHGILHVFHQIDERERAGNIVGKAEKRLLVHFARIGMVAAQIADLRLHLFE